MVNLNNISRHMCVLMPILSCLLFSFNQNLLTKPLRFLQSFCRRHCYQQTKKCKIPSRRKRDTSAAAAHLTDLFGNQLSTHMEHRRPCQLQNVGFNKPHVNKPRNESQLLLRLFFSKCQRSLVCSVISMAENNLRHAER